MKQYIKRQKLIKVGNSYAVTLDRKFVEVLQDSQQTDVAVVYDLDNKTAGLALHDGAFSNQAYKTSVKKAAVTSAVTDEFQNWVARSLKHDEEAMKKLKDL